MAVTTLLLAAVLAPRDPFLDYLCDVTLLQDKAVQAELKIDERQRAQLNSHADWLAAEAERIRADAPADERVERLLQARAVFKTRVLESLTEPQVKRLAQLSLRAMQVVAILDVAVQERLGVTEAQAKRLAEAWKSTGVAVAAILEKAREPVIAKYRAMGPPSEGERKARQEAMLAEIAAADKSAAPEVEKLKAAFEKAVAETLTEGQKREWEALKGPPPTAPGKPGL